MKKVFTTGTFDNLHYGHVNLLKRAKELGDYLVVGLNSDELISYKKPIYTYEQRKIMLEAIKYVDQVVPINRQEDKYKYLQNVDVFCIGSDYIGFDDIEKIKQYVDVVFFERTPEISTTKIKDNLGKVYNTFVIDIDDTISITHNRDFENSDPIQPVIDRINELHDKGWKIILFTARGVNSCGYDLGTIENKYRAVTEQWLLKHDVKYDELIFRKPNADFYIDDKNISIDEFIKRPFTLRRTK